MMKHQLELVMEKYERLQETLDKFMKDNSEMEVALDKVANYDRTGNTIGAFFECKNIAKNAISIVRKD